MTEQSDFVAQVDRAYDRLLARAETDPQLGQLKPLPAVSEAMRLPGLSYREIVATALAGYADRPALGVRDYDIVTNSDGRRTRRFLPAFKTITYGELAAQIEAIAACWQHHPQHRVVPGDYVGFIAFTGAEMAAADLACVYTQAISVPVQANLPQPDVTQILQDVAPVALIASIDNLDLAVTYALQQPSIRSLMVIESDAADDTDCEALAAARARISQHGSSIALATFAELVSLGRNYSWTPPAKSDRGLDAVSMIMYTSGSTGTPKGAIIHEAICAEFWAGIARPQPTIGIAYAPMNHFMGRNMVNGPLAQGGSVYFTLKSDMSTLLEDIRLIRPTFLLFIPRVCEIVYQHYQSELQRRSAAGGSDAAIDAQVRADMSKTYLGDRLFAGGVGSSPTAPEVRAFIASCFDIILVDGYGCTEAGAAAMTFANIVQRRMVVDYKLVDVPELGYYTTDQPYPRGELLVKTRLMIQGYFKRPDASAAIIDPDGYLLTGDIMEERGPDQIAWIDRRNNVIKLSQAEFVAIGPLETAYLGGSALISQIYLYGSSYRPFLLAVVVPDLQIAQARLGHAPTDEEARTMVLAEFAAVARSASLKSFEVPRDVLIEREPFSLENGLLSSVRKPLRPNLKRRYAERLEAIYQQMDRKQQEELALLRDGATGLSVLDRVAGALKANLGMARMDPASAQSYSDLGGDSLGAVALSLLLQEIFNVTVPVSIILHPAGTARRLALYIEQALAAGPADALPSFDRVHGADATEIRTADLTLPAFLTPDALAAAATVAPPPTQIRTVLLTGANGFLGRFLCLEWMERLAPLGGKVICIARGADGAAARARLMDAFGTLDPALTARVRHLASTLEVLAGDLTAPRLGLTEAEFARCAAEVDQIVHPAALVNHMLSYRNLFEPNVAGTAELIRLALTQRLKRFDYVSSLAVPHMIPALLPESEDMDVRLGTDTVTLTDGYASGYGASKWAGEVLLRDAHERFGLPVNVFRGDMILAHSRFAGQINVPDMFTRLLFSVVQTGIAPVSFYELPPDGSRPRAHYDGLPVDFIAAAMQQIGAVPHADFKTYNVINMHADDGISLDRIIDWVASAGYSVHRLRDYADWLHRFADKLRHLPDEQRAHSSLTILGHFAHPHPPHARLARSDNFVAAVRGIPAGPEVPHLTEAFIHKYLNDMERLGLLLPELHRMVA
jgi:fatty acid CoA ligase FadD9